MNWNKLLLKKKSYNRHITSLIQTQHIQFILCSKDNSALIGKRKERKKEIKQVSKTPHYESVACGPRPRFNRLVNNHTS